MIEPKKRTVSVSAAVVKKSKDICRTNNILWHFQLFDERKSFDKSKIIRNLKALKSNPTEIQCQCSKYNHFRALTNEERGNNCLLRLFSDMSSLISNDVNSYVFFLFDITVIQSDCCVLKTGKNHDSW